MPVSRAVPQPPGEPGVPVVRPPARAVAPARLLAQAAGHHVQVAVLRGAGQARQREPGAVDVRQDGAERGEHLAARGGRPQGAVAAAGRGLSPALADHAGPRDGDPGGGRPGEAVSWQAKLLAEGGQLAGHRAVRGQRASVGEYPHHLAQAHIRHRSRHVPGARNDPLGVPGEPAFGRCGGDRPGAARPGAGRSGVSRSGRGGRPGLRAESQPDEPARSVGDQVEPSGVRVERGREPDDAVPRSGAAITVEADRITTAVVVSRPELVVGEMLRSGPGDLQIGA